MASNREYDQDPDVTIGIRLPIDENWTPSESTMSAAEFNIQNLLKTKYGERFAHPSFGCALASILFEQMDDSINDKVDEALNDAIDKWLPYLRIVNIDTKIDNRNRRLNISLTYALKNDPTRTNTTMIVYT